MSRPTVITNKVLRDLKTAFSFGSTDKEACVFANISEKTLYNHQKRNPEFLQEKQVWKSELILKARMAVFEAIESGDAVLALKYLKLKLPHEFGGGRVKSVNDLGLREAILNVNNLTKES